MAAGAEVAEKAEKGTWKPMDDPPRPHQYLYIITADMVWTYFGIKLFGAEDFQVVRFNGRTWQQMFRP
jgi:hypothetical protein